MRVVASYAVPVDDLLDQPRSRRPRGPPPEYRPVGFGDGRPPLLDPSVPFAVHTADGDAVPVSDGDRDRRRRSGLDDPDLADYVILDFDGFDWSEEDEPLVGSPARPVPPDRRPPQLAPGPDRARGDAARRSEPGSGRCSRASSRCRGATSRARTSRRELTPSEPDDDLRLQGARHPLRRAGRRRRAAEHGRGPTRSRSTTPTAGARSRGVLPGAARRRGSTARRSDRVRTPWSRASVSAVSRRTCPRWRRPTAFGTSVLKTLGMMKFGLSSSSLTDERDRLGGAQQHLDR